MTEQDDENIYTTQRGEKGKRLETGVKEEKEKNNQATDIARLFLFSLCLCVED